MIHGLYKKAFEIYPTNVDVYDSAIEDEPKYQQMMEHIRQKRIAMPVATILEEVKTYFPRNSCRDSTYLFSTNPSYRIEIFSQKLIFKLLISLLADVYTVKEVTREIYEQNKNVMEVDSEVIQKNVRNLLPNFSYVKADQLEHIMMPDISCNSKMLGDATLFDCFFNDNEW